MLLEEFEEIMADDERSGVRLNEPGDNALKGLLIITKYLPNSGIEGANHDVIYSCSAEDLVNAGITTEDAILLNALNWMVDDESLACFV